MRHLGAYHLYTCPGSEYDRGTSGSWLPITLDLVVEPGNWHKNTAIALSQYVVTARFQRISCASIDGLACIAIDALDEGHSPELFIIPCKDIIQVSWIISYIPALASRNDTVKDLLSTGATSHIANMRSPPSTPYSRNQAIFPSMALSCGA